VQLAGYGKRLVEASMARYLSGTTRETGASEGDEAPRGGAVRVPWRHEAEHEARSRSSHVANVARSVARCCS